ncbi:Ribose transport system permease protein RbsC [Thalassovita gelatinovora]|uniref:Ribose transport system permease protein RbsC n=1 Tax=Thalassovita gelatinovora TaxID=53501 RepID=A0A0P1FBI7_THAGE|nr:ABC transporter permease [Thalassovita gelatinovora]QIZ80647.1 ABC transporter permease [Thalassovita gelatinovora]CUH65206.1 Ribose transport system permease protein RbsC [Thalassovita gelatinovora]SEQ87445.1 monosaccharide ABC transporter membrane protein, CUT2 family [Thalassovita gelatinovora]
MSEPRTKMPTTMGSETAPAVSNATPKPTVLHTTGYSSFKPGPFSMAWPGFWGAVVCFAVFSILIEGFFSADVLSNVLLVSARLGVVATGVGLLLIQREFDLSVGAVFTLAGGMTIVGINIGLIPGFTIAAVLTGAGIIGALNGYLVARLKLHSLLVTFVTMLACHAAVVGLGQYHQMQLSGYSRSFGLFDFWVLGGIPVSVIWMVLLVLLAALGLGWTRLGNWIYATGADPQAAREMGVPVTSVRLQSFAIASALAALAGVMSSVQTGHMVPKMGDILVFEALLAALVGGVPLRGGRGTVSGIICGVLILKMSQQALLTAGGDPVWYRAGVMVALAVIMLRFLMRSQEA